MYGKGFVNTWKRDNSKQLKIFSKNQYDPYELIKKVCKKVWKLGILTVSFSMCALIDNILKILALKVLSFTNFSKSGQGKKSCKAV